jgi:hypothetical protein
MMHTPAHTTPGSVGVAITALIVTALAWAAVGCWITVTKLRARRRRAWQQGKDNRP